MEQTTVDGVGRPGTTAGRRAAVSDSSRRARMPAPDRDQVHVWWMPLVSLDDREAGDLALLDEAERARTGRFRFDRHRVRFTRRHAFVRRVLARYLDVAPALVPIDITASGRPELGTPSDISFNLSSADDLAALAVTRGCRVGIDIERVRPIDDALDVAEGMFTEAEVALLRALPPTPRSQAFLSLWTRKESLVKAVGAGLSMPLDRFDVLEQDDHGVGRAHGPAGVLPFTIGRLATPHRYVGAVTLVGDHLDIQDMGWEPTAR